MPEKCTVSERVVPPEADVFAFHRHRTMSRRAPRDQLSWQATQENADVHDHQPGHVGGPHNMHGQHAAQVEAVPAEPQEEGRRTPSPPLTPPPNLALRGLTTAMPQSAPTPQQGAQCCCLKNPGQGRPSISALRWCASVQRLSSGSSRGGGDRGRPAPFRVRKNSDCRGHDLHNP